MCPSETRDRRKNEKLVIELGNDGGGINKGKKINTHGDTSDNKSS